MLPGSDNTQPLGLRLEVVGCGGRPTEGEIACLFAQRGGNVGRATENDCVLPDSEGVVSRVHAAVKFQDGEYYLIDQSTNGVFLNGSPDRLEVGREYPIRDGDRILIGDFMIEASLVVLNERSGLDGPADTDDHLIDMRESEDPASDPFGIADDVLGELPDSDGSSHNVRRPDWFPDTGDEGPDADNPAAQVGQGGERAPVPVLAQHMGPSSSADAGLLPPEAPPDSPGGPAERRLSGGGVPTGYVPFGDQFEGFPDGGLIPDSASEAASIPVEEESAGLNRPDEGAAEAPVAPEAEDRAERVTAADLGGGKQPEPMPMPTTKPSALARGNAGPGEPDGESVQASESRLFAAFLEGLDVPSLAVPPEQAPEFMHQIGRMVRESVQGLIDTLRLRAEFKREFYVPATSIAPVENNLFKYSVNVDDAMSRLLSDSGSAYMGPAESTRLAFQDVAAHHLALVAGMEAAVNTLLERFSPDALRDRVGKATLVEGMLPQYRKARMWEEFEKEYQQIAQQAAEDFQEILGQNFARAYTEQMRRLEHAGFGGKNNDNEQS